MTELRAETLSPIDAATLWPQLSRLSTEVVAVRGGEHLLVTSGLAATGLTRLPRIPRTAVLGVRRGLRYRGVVVARELSGGSAWEIVSARLAREKDDEVVRALLAGACAELAGRRTRNAFLRYPEGSTHAAAMGRAGFVAHSDEALFAFPRRPADRPPPSFRPAARADRAALFRLYCRAVPEHARRQEAVTQHEWRSLIDSYDCPSGWIAERNGSAVGWIALGEREARVLLAAEAVDLAEAALDLAESQLGRRGTLVVPEYAPEVRRAAIARGYLRMGTRRFCARRLVLLESLKEVAPAHVIEAAPVSG